MPKDTGNDFAEQGIQKDAITSVQCYHPAPEGLIKYCAEKKQPVPSKCGRHLFQVFWAHLTPGAKAVVWVSMTCPRCRRKVKISLSSAPRQT